MRCELLAVEAKYLARSRQVRAGKHELFGNKALLLICAQVA